MAIDDDPPQLSLHVCVCWWHIYSPHRGHAVRELTSGRFGTAQLSPEGTRVSLSRLHLNALHRFNGLLQRKPRQDGNTTRVRRIAFRGLSSARDRISASRPDANHQPNEVC